MLKIRIHRVGSTLAASSLLFQLGAAGLAGAAATGCIAPDVPDAGAASREQGRAAGAATLELGYSSSVPGALDLAVTASTTDEFVRTGEKLKVSVPGWLAWQTLHPNDPTPDAARTKKLRIEAHAKFLSNGQVVKTKVIKSSANTWTGDNYYNLVTVTSKSVTVPDDIDAVAIDIVLKDLGDAAATATIGADAVGPVQVFGGQGDLRHVLFDNDAGDLRERVVEDEPLISGASAVVSYTDWRANTLVDSYSINRQIGVVQGWGRFGQFSMPIFGDLVNEVSMGWYADDAQGWRPEAALPAVTDSRLLPEGRKTFQTELALSAGTTKLAAWFHVKTYLVADYSKYGNVTQSFYQQGDKILVAEKWDNPSGSYSNYEYGLEEP